jgi:adenylate kinase
MRLVILGAPGSGKGTQAALLKNILRVPHISTGELLRAQVAAGTELGKAAKEVMALGNLVSDEIVLGMLESRLSDADVKAGFILDGYPRNLKQCEALESLLSKINMPVEVALQLDVPDELLLPRLQERARKEGRADDSPESVRNRLTVYHGDTAPVIGHYQRQNLLKRVSGVGAISEITSRITGALSIK